MSGLPAHLLGFVDTNDLGSITPEAAVLHNITVMRQRVANSRLSIAQKSVHLNLIDQVLAKWDTPERMLYIQKAAEAERIYEAQGLMGFAGVDAVEGLSGFWGSVGGFFKKAGSAIASGAKKAFTKVKSMVSEAGGGGGEQQQEAPQEQEAPQQQYVAPQQYAAPQQRRYASAAPPQRQYASAASPQQQQGSQDEPKKWYQKTPAKVGMGVGGALVLGTVIFLVTRKPKPQYQYAPVNPRYNPPQPQQLQGIGGAKKKTVKHSEKQKNATDAKVVKPIKKVELK